MRRRSWHREPTLEQLAVMGAARPVARANMHDRRTRFMVRSNDELPNDEGESVEVPYTAEYYFYRAED